MKFEIGRWMMPPGLEAVYPVSVQDVKVEADALVVTGYTGSDLPALAYGSYPYLIHSQYRSGISHHYSEGAHTTLRVTYGEEDLDVGACQTRLAEGMRDETGLLARLTPAQLKFKNGPTAEIVTKFHFPGQGKIIIERRLASISDPQAELRIQEFMRAGYGTIEHPDAPPTKAHWRGTGNRL